MSKHYKGNVAKDDVLVWEVKKGKEQKLSYPEVVKVFSHLMGEVLTVIDASYANEAQRKAVKDLVRGQFHAKFNWIYELCGYPAGSDVIDANAYADEQDCECGPHATAKCPNQ